MKSCLVLEGGGLRGIYTAGVLDVFLDNNISIDCIIGVSMGSLIGINYCSKQRGRAIRYNLKYCNDKRYIGLNSFLKTGNVANKQFDYYDIPDKLDPFDYDEFKKSKVEFLCTVTNLETGKAEYIEINDCKKQVEYLRAGSSIPGLSKIVKIDDKKYLDGGIGDSIPVRKAIQLGYDKIIVVTTRDINYRKGNSKMKTLSRIYKKYPNFVKSIKSRNKRYNDTVDEVISLEKKGDIFVIRPSKRIKVRRIEKRRSVIKEQYDLGVLDTVNCLDKLNKYLKG